MHRRFVAIIGLCLGFLTSLSGPVTYAQSNLPRDEDQLFLFEPTDLEGYIESARLALGLGREDRSQQYLAGAVDLQPSDGDLLNARAAFGVGQFLEFAANPNLQPEAGELLALVNQATRQTRPEPEEIANLLPDLAGPDDAVKAAYQRILLADDRAALPLLDVAADAPERQRATTILQRNIRRYRFALTEAFAGATPAGQTQILNMLSTSGDSRLLPYLLPGAFSDEQTVRSAYDRAEAALSPSTALPRKPSSAANLLIQHLIEALQTADRLFPTENPIPGIATLQTTSAGIPASGSIDLSWKAQYERPVFQAVRLANAAVAILDNNTTRAAQLSALTAAEEPTAFSDEGRILAALQFSITHDCRSAARSLLARITPDTVANAASPAEVHRLLHQCQTSTDPEIRIRAAHLISQSYGRPRESLTDVLLRDAANGSLQPEAVVIDGNQNRAGNIASILTDEGFVASNAATGQEGMVLAAKALQCELILIHENISATPLSVTLASLRSDARTANAPIVIYGAGRGAAAHSEATRGIWYLPMPLTASTLSAAQQTLSARIKQSRVTGKRLSEQQRQALIDLAASTANAQ